MKTQEIYFGCFTDGYRRYLSMLWQSDILTSVYIYIFFQLLLIVYIFVLSK